uniref:Ring finger protein 213 n=1 Tax=Labrus bergylta TaxID=56723 RepID=A0A3Q3GTF4_9LABR
METGQTVVLLNLQNLYESLYDALNQYYVTFGGQKYVDLGLGTHRVKCRVHKNFRLIVIEEKEVVYEQFPIPLINRLEKHYLDINTVLRDEQKDIVQKLQKWVDDFVSLTSQHHTMKQYVPSDVFIGYHSDTCSSVVLQVTETHSDETDAQIILDKAKEILLNCATPDSVIRLDKSRLPDEEREHLMKEYVKEEMHSSFGDYIVYHRKELAQSRFFFTEVTTFSRLLTAADTQKLQSTIMLDNIRLLSLQQFDTEYSFLKKIRECLGSTPADRVLIIQTDYEEDSHKRNVFSSAKYACVNEINKWATADNTKPLVYFVTKLPRIEGGTSFVGFQGGPWRSVHIDDLRRSKEFVTDVNCLKKLCMSEIFEDPPEGNPPENFFLKQYHTYDIHFKDIFTFLDAFLLCMMHCNFLFIFLQVLEGLLDIPNLLRSCVQSAVSMLRDSTDNAKLSTKRVESLLTLLDESQTQGVFTNIVRKCIHSLLEDYEANIPNPKSWVLREASNVSALQEGGTFLHTLWRKIQAVVAPLLANLVSVIDRDCNLQLLLKGCDELKGLWLEIFGNPNMLLVPYVRVESKISQGHITGGNTMCCRLPFSWWIKEFLEGLMMQTSRHKNHSPGRFLEVFLNTPLGRYLNENVNENMRKEFFERYLQDFVAMTFKVASDEELQLMCQALASCVDEVKRRKRDEDELSLPLVHIAHHFFQRRLQNLSRMFALQPDVLTPLRKNQHIGNCQEMVLDVHAAQACVECLGSPKVDTDALCQDWLKQVKSLQASLEMICSHIHTKLYGQRCKEILQAVSNGWKRIHILSLFAEHMLLGFHNDENQIRVLVQSHIQTLSRCRVCMRKPQDPVGLPCHHIYCLTCIRASLDAGKTACPTCRQELPNDFQPHVSEEIRVTVKKHAEFRRRCNGFFIDLLSTVCFKDNSPPARDVIKHLLSYLMVETENREIHTKDLSPFDESPDKNPVVRSVILKLLLKFSFDEVKEYLQQHLSSIEDSRFVHEEDTAELYALYINCLENEDGGQMDQYLLYGEEYKAVRDAVAMAVVGGEVEQIEEKCTAPPRNRTMFILLALFREVTTLYRSANTGLHLTPERRQVFEEFIQGSRYLHQEELRTFASALVDNRLGALTMNPDHPITHNTVIELTIHLEVVLLTGTQPLLMPLKQLGLFPENMQVNINSPLSIYKIAFLHQMAKWLGIFQTRPGHILGDPEQRNNPNALDTKNMSLAPFTLVRLVTHLPMLLGASEKPQFVQNIIQPPVEDVCQFLTLHILKDLEQLSQTLGRGADDTVTTVHLVLRSLQELMQTSHSDTDLHLSTKESRNNWETTVAAEIMTPRLRDLDLLLQEAKGSIRTDSRVSSNFIIRTTLGDDCTFLTSLAQCSQVHSSAVWSCRDRLSLLRLTHIVEQNDQKEDLPLLWRFLQKEREFRQIKHLPSILTLQKHLVRKFQNTSDQIGGSIGDFIKKQTGKAALSVTNEMKIPDEFSSHDLSLDSDLQYLLPRHQGPGLCATGLVSYLVSLQNELVNAVDTQTGEDNRESVAELTEQHVIHYEVDKDLLPLILSNCQYSLERGHETISQYDLPRIQRQILTRFLQGKPLITRTGIPTLVNTQERDYDSIFKAVKGKVHQDTLSSLTRNALSRELESYSEVCEALKIVELLLGFLSMTGGDPMMPLVAYLQDVLKMANNIDHQTLKVSALGRCTLRHCVCLWQLLSSLKSEKMLQRLKREPFSGYPTEYQMQLTEEDKIELKGFLSRGIVDQWLLEMHEFLLLNLGRPRATDDYTPTWGVKETVAAYMDGKKVEVPLYVEDKFPENLTLSQIVETWKYSVTARQEFWSKHQRAHSIFMF